MTTPATQRTLGVVVQQIECLTFTIAHAVSALGWRVVVIADPDLNKSRQNAIYATRLSELPDVTVEMGFQPIELDFLYVELTRLSPVDRVRYYCDRARRIGVITYTDRPTWGRTFLAEVMDARRCLRCVLRARRFIYAERSRWIDFYAFLGRRQPLGIDVHSSFLRDPQLRDMMFGLDWEPRRRRQYRLNFMGSGEPDTRADILAAVELAIKQRGISLARTPDEAGEIIWLAAERVSEARFCQFLTQSDYTLCPRGWGRLTHRVVEALLRGSIPILQADELKMYDLDLESGKNCIAAPPGRWGETVLAALSADAESIVHMRENILRMRESHLDIAASNRRLCRRLGIDDKDLRRSVLPPSPGTPGEGWGGGRA